MLQSATKQEPFQSQLLNSIQTILTDLDRQQLWEAFLWLSAKKSTTKPPTFKFLAAESGEAKK